MFYTPGIRIHQFPSDPVLRRKWTQFVHRHWADWKLTTKYALMCSAHFEDACNERSSLLASMASADGSLSTIFSEGGLYSYKRSVVSELSRVEHFGVVF